MTTFDWVDALRNIPAKGYRQTRNGRYEAFVSNHSKTIMLGTYDTIEDAKNAVLNYRVVRLVSNIDQYDLNPDDAVIYENNYLVFENGMIFNLQGERMTGNVGRGGYRHGIFNGRNRDHHKVIADCFIPNPGNLRDVNHKNGNKLDLRVENLERTTHADNVIHAYKNGLMKAVYGEKHPHAKLTEDDVRYIRSSTKTTAELAREMNLHCTTVRDIRNRKSWRHVK